MNVLFATDGSPRDHLARRFVAGARWPAGTQIELFGVAAPVSFAMPGELTDRNVRDFEHELDFLATSLPQRDCRVTWRYAIGQPAELIAARACAMEADLIIVGSRGRGAIATSVLGSVSAGVIDRAPCAVLVARTGAIGRIVIADDGSVGAAAAAAFVNEWSIFGDAALQILTVVDVGRPLSGLDDRAHARATIEARLHSIRPRPRGVKTCIRDGDAASEILAAAHDFAADLIVVGSRGQTGLARVLAGSTARRVLVGAKCSVLIARGSAQVHHEQERTMPLAAVTLA